jgi:hypothetical protein
MADVTKEIVLEVGLKDSTAAGTTSAKTRLRELQKTLADMALAGQDGTKAFRDMEREAGKLKDQIGDTQQRIKNLASDTRTIDTFVGADPRYYGGSSKSHRERRHYSERRKKNSKSPWSRSKRPWPSPTGCNRWLTC